VSNFSKLVKPGAILRDLRVAGARLQVTEIPEPNHGALPGLGV
jgi:hypothetical protein